MRIVRLVLNSVTKTATGSDSTDGREGRDISEARGNIEIYVNATTVSGTTPSLTVQMDDGFIIEGTQGMNTAGTPGSVYQTSVLSSPPAITAVGLTRIASVADYGTLVRFSWTISGTTPSFTFEIYLVYEVAD